MNSAPSPWIRKLLFWLISAALLAILLVSIFATVSAEARRTADSSNLRSIAQSTLIFAQDHKGKLPHAVSVWDYARQLAESDQLDSGSIWQSRGDPALVLPAGQLQILLPEKKGVHAVNPAFLQIKPCFAIPKGELHTKMPMTTPVLWTRGLQSDGSWAKHSPYGTSEGGHIVFLGGNIVRYKNLADAGDQLFRFDGKGQTSNILEALPPGTQISEYIPTPAEQKKWAWVNGWRSLVYKAVNPWSAGFIFLGIVVTPIFGFSKYSHVVGTRCLLLTILLLTLLAVAIACV